MTDEKALLPEADPPEPRKRMRADALARADRAWRLRVVGASWAEVAEAVGYSCEANAVRAVREVYGELPAPERSELRHLWRERLERLWRQAFRDALDRRPGAVAAAVRVEAAAARLDGLDAPTEVVVHSPTDQEIRQWVQAVSASPILEIEEADVLDDEGS